MLAPQLEDTKQQCSINNHFHKIGGIPFIHKPHLGFHDTCLDSMKSTKSFWIRATYYMRLCGFYYKHPECCFTCHQSYILQFEFIKSKLKNLTLEQCRYLNDGDAKIAIIHSAHIQ